MARDSKIGQYSSDVDDDIDDDVADDGDEPDFGKIKTKKLKRGRKPKKAQKESPVKPRPEGARSNPSRHAKPVYADYDIDDNDDE
ncbi:hypothetical protein TVAG_204860 [Trichomonas vaginalis G3]|uniref:Uncharacterized protein n=1 Tax=Trichomonas vaginalis (strain ATCC PRA-98 / G3) TaxID=412133 RepID=A2EIY9_TRIV3|nr:hypothetical protein TVAGG3_0661600 [Trichomonas vaginalis G3]EAY07379.1 hypothetical protein TVAG_204860 [Trichomonas vaginalis G3]KAI5506532.1 hypothetical protein TVAGG3_0661600 [Trichomonas vaginalis G3]|eukprot:XP_001319602.1 hypothetical protein [Trichomonas vaginalis G3]